MRSPTLQQIAARCAPEPLLRSAAVLLLDGVAIAAAWRYAWSIRFDGLTPAFYLPLQHQALPALLALRLGVLAVARLDRWSFRTPGAPEAVRLLGAQLTAAVLFLAFAAGEGLGLPRSIHVLELLLSSTLIAAGRFAPRLALGWWRGWRAARQGTQLRALIVGAGEAAELLARDVQRSVVSPYRLVGFVDDDRSRRGSRLVGRPVLGTLAELPAVIAHQRVSVVLLAIVGLGADRVRELLAVCAASRVRFKIIPTLGQLDARISAAALQELRPEDLLPRKPVDFDAGEIGDRVRGRCVLVTGAGGSIGGEIARQLAARGVGTLVLLDMNENELYLSARRLARAHPALAVHAEVADIRERGPLLRIGQRFRPQFVFHAAAHKHVPLMEEAPEEAIKNNVFGTLHVARMASECGAERFVLISTDKAVHPTSIMGVSKRLAELVVHDLARRSATVMTVVRFGNVLGSAGSVVPIFKEQIASGGPVTITHPECTRYFMTIPEAVGLVLVAGLRCDGDLCVLDMGDPIRIVDLARHLITMAGRVPGAEIPIVYTGLRPGEKLCEELFSEDEEQLVRRHGQIRVVRCRPPPAALRAGLAALRRAAREGDREALLAQIRALVPSYQGPAPQAVPAGAGPLLDEAAPAPHGERPAVRAPAGPPLRRARGRRAGDDALQEPS